MYILQFLLVAKVSSDVKRHNDGFQADFSVINKGRLYNTLIYHEHLDFGECLFECIRFLNCVTFNYHSESKTCELTDEGFDWYEADVDTPGWYNYGTPPKVDGGFSEWIKKSPCSPTCGDNNGQQIETRHCTNPEPKFGGADCVGENTRVVPCNLKPCQIDGGFTKWRSNGPCSATCSYEGKQMQTRECTNPKPRYGGAECVGEKIRYVVCGGPCQMVACERTTLRLSCPYKSKMKIINASYGRSNRAICPGRNDHITNCHAPSSDSVMKATCDGKNSCSKEATNSNFTPDPCSGTHKYLSVLFKCE